MDTKKVESWMPSDEEINAACNEDDSPHYQPGEASFVTTAPLVRAFVRTAVERALAEQEARHRREVIEARIDAIENFDGWTSFEWAKEMRAELAALEAKP